MAKTILIVDDQQGIRLLLEELFRQEGYTTKVAANGQEALELARGEQPDCVLLDMKMPGMDGLEVLEKLIEKWSSIRVMMMTAYDELQLTERALQLGAVKYFTKPFDIFEVRDAVKLLFED